MFKFTVDNSADFTAKIVAANVLVEEATFKLDTEGLTLKMMDPSRVCMINLEIPKETFVEYSCINPVKLALNLTNLLSLLKRAGKNDKITFEQADDGKLSLQIDGDFPRRFTLPTLEPDETDVPTPLISFTAKASFAAGTLSQTIEDAQIVSDHFQIRADNEKIVFDASGDLMNAKITMLKDNPALLCLTVQAPCKSTYSLSYLSEIVKACASFADTVNMELSTDLPVKLDFIMQFGKAEFFLAPRIDEAAN